MQSHYFVAFVVCQDSLPSGWFSGAETLISGMANLQSFVALQTFVVWPGPLSGSRQLFALYAYPGIWCVGCKRHRRRGLGMGPRPYCGGAW